MLIKALLPLIAVIKFKCDGHHGELFGKEIATVYKACKEELNRPQHQVRAAGKAG